ncbi:hypothetical protein ABTL59_19635, partial [Acinetobacter baumannii]
FHLATILVGGIFMGAAVRRGSGVGVGLVLLVGLLMQAIPTGALYLYSTGPGKGAALWLGFAFGPLGAAAAVLWLLVGLGVSMFVT